MAYRKFPSIKICFALTAISLLIFLFTSCKQDYQSAYQFSYDSDIFQEEDSLITAVVKSNYIPKKWEYVIIHCTANYKPINKDVLLKIFKSYGWSKPGYHLFINRDGSIDTLVQFNKDRYITYSEIANGAKGYNSVSIHISYDGGVDENLRPKDTRTIYQKVSLYEILRDFKLNNPDLKIIGHNNISNKACPSFDVLKEYESLNK